MKFQKAVRRMSRARIALSGPSGSGKTYGALLLARGLGGPDARIAVIDTERGSASLYAGMKGVPEFDALDLEPPYSPERFIEAMKAAAEGGYTVVIIDGITPEWNGIGGCLEINEHLAAAKFRGNTWSAWNETTPRHRRFIDSMLAAPYHLIVTMRSKTETTQEEKNGRKVVVKLGMKNEQRDGIEYEFTSVLDIAHGGHYATASKDRSSVWADRDPAALTVEDGERFRQWLESADDTPSAPEQQEQPPYNVATTIAMIEQCASEEDLHSMAAKIVAAYKAAKAAGDQEGAAAIKAAKDRREAVLAQPEQEAA